MDSDFTNYYNRVQIYLDNEVFAQFKQLCSDKGRPRSEVGNWIFKEFFRLSKEQPSQANSKTDRSDSLQSQIDELRKTINRLEDKFDSSLEAELQTTRTNSARPAEDFANLIPENYHQGRIPFTQPKAPASNLEFPSELETTPQEELSSNSSSEENPDIYIKTDSRDETELVENVPPGATNKPETKVQNAFSKTSKQKPYIPKDIQKLNEAGGIQITKGENFGHEVLDEYFTTLLQGRFVLEATDKRNAPYWISGARHTKPSGEFLEARLYHSESRMKTAIPKLEQKFDLTITSKPAIDFLRDMSRTEREKMISNWGIKFSFSEG